MTEPTSRKRAWRGLVPQSKPALFGILIVAVVAFFLGGLLLGDGSSPGEAERASHGEAAEASRRPDVWTCSMHPQIQLPKPGKCPICFMDLIPVESRGGEELGPRQIRMSEAAKELARIETSVVRGAFAEREVRMVGKVAYDETSVANIAAWVPGRLDRLYADYTGITVRKGDHMVRVYSPELLATQEELLQAITAVKALADTKSKVLRSTAAATLDAAREKLRLYGLTEGQIIAIESSGEVSDHLTIYAPIGGVVVQKDALEGMYVQTGTRIYTIADLTQLWVMFEAYESDLPWLRYGQKVTFTSPSFPGQTFEALISFIYPVVDPKTRSVTVRGIVDNRDLKLKPDMFVHGVVVSRVDGEGDVIDENLAGKWISPMHPEVVKDGPGRCDVCGMPLVPAESLGYATRGAADESAPLLVPASAPLITGKRAIVYVEVSDDEGPLFEGREVELGPRAGNFYVVKSGLSEGELVVTNGAFKIDSELQIQAKPSMMSPEGGAPAPAHQHGSLGDDVDNSHQDAQQAAARRIQEAGEVLGALVPVYDAYFMVQMALANDDNENAKSAAREVEGAVKRVDMKIFSHSGHERWMDISKSMITAAQRIGESDDIEAARDGFFHLSNASIELHDTFGHKGEGDYYLTFCPMARNNAGAFWLQTENVVWNSLYGASMLRCGEIKKKLPPAAMNTE